VQSVVGKQGWLQAKEITISSFENEDHILFAAFDDEGNVLLEKILFRYSVPCRCQQVYR
jgi:hypothetical protein